MENTPVRKLMELNSSIDSISWHVRLPNAFEKQDYRGEVRLPPCDSARFVLTGVTGVDESQHGLKIEVDENKFSITGTPDLSALRKDGQPAPSEFTLTAKYRLEVDGASGGAYEGERNSSWSSSPPSISCGETSPSTGIKCRNLDIKTTTMRPTLQCSTAKRNTS